MTTEIKTMDVHQAVCPLSECDYRTEWFESVDAIVGALTLHLSTHSIRVMACYIADMLKEDPYDSHDDSRPYYLTKHVSK